MNTSPPAPIWTSKTAAHVLPLAVFMIFNLVPGLLRVENSELPWYQRAPEHWLYPIQTLICGGLLIAFRSHYTFKPWRCFSLAVFSAGLGIALWISPSWLHSQFAAEGDAVPEALKWLGAVERKNGFDPGMLTAWPGWQWAAIGMRFLRLVILVPVIEEIFWRGFLMRYLIADDRPWDQILFGTHRWKAFWISTLLVMLAHQPQDYAAAFVWGTLVYFLAVRSKSLGACVIMHGTANLLLGVYIMRTQTWGLW